MRILVSNDDGIHSIGIKVLADAMKTISDVFVIAPDRDCSGSSNSLTLTKPLRINHIKNNFYSVDGTPVDCVNLALSGFIKHSIDMVVSGINDSANLGDDVLYSGTIAAAMEGRYLKFPSISFSIVGKNKIYNYNTAAVIARKLVIKIINNIFPPKTIFNVNIPDLPINEIHGIQITRLGSRDYSSSIIRNYDPRGKLTYWIGPHGIERDSGPGTDIYAINNNCVSITPLHLDFTYHDLLKKIKFLENIIYYEL